MEFNWWMFAAIFIGITYINHVVVPWAVNFYFDRKQRKNK